MNNRFSADDFPRIGSAVPRAIDLAHAPPFQLGGVEVRPASRELIRGGRRETVEPLVMQVLVALASAKGQTLSRDDLIDACWGGRAVSDDAISRVVSRLRNLGKSLGGFAVETMSKIGYRLVETEAASPETPARTRISRRGAIAGGGAAVLALGSAALWWRQPWRNHPPPEAEQLYRRGALLAREGMPGQVEQMTAYFESAVQADPAFGGAWGALALSYSHMLQGFDNREAASLRGRIQSAASRALELDPDNADAQLALIFVTPFYGNWAAKELALRNVVQRHPRHWLALGRFAVLMYEVGRLGDGIRLHRRALDIEPMLPVAKFHLITQLSALGRLQEAEALIEESAQRWPTHPALWFATFDHFLASGRYQAASALLADRNRRPMTVGPPQIEIRQVLMRAAESRDPASVALAIDRYRRLAEANVGAVETAAPVFALLGDADLTFASLDRYYFNRGPFGRDAPRGPHDQRRTAFLFGHAMSSARADPRFPVLLRSVGLEDYWRQRGTSPDYRRMVGS